jgi:Kef-type K+ transport system membrane component KefB
MSLFFLWIAALLFGRLVGYFYLPPLLGMLLAGILIRNVDVFAEFWQINSNWDQILRRFAFILILIRCGVNLESKALRQSLSTFISLGLLPTTVEAIAIILVSYYLFAIPFANSLLFACVLTATSPAVTVPAIISLGERGYIKDNRISTTILASVSIDNIYCITVFTVVESLFFTGNSE